MNNKFLIFVAFAVVTLSAFAGGYWLGTEKTLRQLNTQIYAPSTPNDLFEQKHTNSFGVKKQNRKNDTGLATTTTDSMQSDSQQNNQTLRQEETTVLTLAKDASVIEMMEYLLMLGVSENADAVDQFGPTLDALREAVNKDPNNMQMLVDYFVDSDEASQAPYYITSVLQGADIQDKDLIINNMIGRLSTQGTSSANKKLLHLVSSTGAHHDNEQVINTLKNIALYSQTDDNNRTYALDLLMPYQLTSDEKSKVVNDLSFALTQAGSEEVSYMVENIIRFSDQEKRISLASSYLADTNDFSTRIAILSTMHNGSIKPNDTLKAALFDIAQNTSDPLSKHAKDTLMYVFEIDNNEYKRLRTGG